ncbi:helix-turn-helix domain-containing protein [Paucisalibacillus sp. EB02]|uniref:helix-turn-helix domain-containing protein n=1 Tax=Paucisalibacillus sp. EB02 TaxID=1347087 RepID=UPI0004AD987B|nr:helix-turn-helix domain-containing protein [Paucisalibacillus sp. EB02]
MYVEGITLDCLTQIKFNRSIYGIYHLLTGKKSIQSVHDARIFQLEKYYGVHLSLTRNQFLQIVNVMLENGLLNKDDGNEFYHVTKAGKEKLSLFQGTTIFSYLNGLSFSGIERQFRDRLYLLVQTYSNILVNNYSFIPIVDSQEVTKWVKDFYRRHQQSNFPDQLYHELYQLLSLLPKGEADFFVDRLSGYQYYGLSMEQLAIKYNLSRDDTIIYLTGITHVLINLVSQKKEAYPILSQLIIGFDQQKFITNTANQTFHLLKKQYSLEQIVQIRNLKLNTIYDHIVEIALYDSSFQIESYVNKKEQEEIIAAIQLNNTFKLKTIKESCSSTISYFQIRLVLTRLKELLPEGEIHV